MKNIIMILLMLTGISLRSQTAEKWERIYGGPAIEYGYSVRSCLNQGYIVAGSTSSNGITDGLLLRVDSIGMVMWSKTYAGNNVDVYRSVRILPDSGFIIAGYTNSSGYGGYDGLLVRTDKNGDSIWSKKFGTNDWDFFYDVYATADGGFIAAGGTYGRGAGDEDLFFVKTDMNGDTLWTKTYGGLREDEARGIYQTGDQLYAACGYTNSLGDTLGDCWILRIDQNGDTLWTQTLGVPNAKDIGWGISNCSTYNRFFVAGETHASGNADCFIRGITYSGTVIYTDIAGGNDEDYFTSIVSHADGTSAGCGITYSYGGGNGDAYIGENRYINSYTTHGTLQEDKGFGIDTTLDNGYILCGYTTGYNSILPNLYLVKMDSLGYSTGVLDVHEAPSPGLTASCLISPNPSVDLVKITVHFTSEIPDESVLTVYDLTGRELPVSFLQNELNPSARTAEYLLDIRDLPAGIYYFSMNDSRSIITNGKFIKTSSR